MMHRLSILALVAGHSVAVARPLCTPARSLELAALAPSTDLRLTEKAGKLVVAGTPTASPWPMRAPAAYRLPDGRYLLYDGYDANMVYVWQPRTKTLTELGRAVLVAVPRLGWLVEQTGNDGVARLYDLEPKAAALRELWRSADGVEVAGTLDGAIALRAGQRIVCLSGPGATTTLATTLPAGARIAGDDAIRGHRMLLIAGAMPDPGSWPGGHGTFDVAIEILDLGSGKVRTIGVGAGAWTRTTDVPHPYVAVHWSDRDRNLRDPGWAEDVIDVVDVTTETLRVPRVPDGTAR